ncbi:MAG: hypothetical protein ACLUGJ_19640 [Blautia wexlerae]
MTKRGEYYYIMCAEGGTGYNHCVTMGRSKMSGDHMKKIRRILL